MNNIKFYFILFFLFTILSLATGPARAQLNDRWSFGFMTGYSIGGSSVGDVDDGWFDGLYETVPVMFVFDYKFAERWSLRGGLGADINTCSTANCLDYYYEGMPQIFPALQVDALYHLNKNEHAFNPYIGAGLRAPFVNPQAVIGANIKIGKKTFLTMEFSPSWLPTLDGRFEGHIGLMIKP